MMAIEWINERIRRKAGSGIVFRGEWFPVTGLAAVEDGKCVAVASLFLEKSTSIAVCGWLVGDPANRAALSGVACRKLIGALPGYARDLGAGILMSFFGHKMLNKFCGDAGFVFGEKSINQIYYLG